MRALALAATAAVLCWRAAPAAAQSACLGGNLEPIDILLPDGEGDFVEQSEPDVIDFFNLAHCVCPEVFAAEFQLTGGDNTMTEEGEIWLGTDCESAVNLMTREEQCLRLDSTFTDVVVNIDTPQKVPINAADLMFPNSPICEFETVNRGVYLIVDDDNTNDNVFLCETHTAVAIDTEAPPMAVDPEALPGEAAVVVQWTVPTSRADDIEFYQALCSRVDGASDADDFPRDDPEFETGMSLCGADDGTRLEDLSGAGGTTTPFDGLPVATVCGTATGTETSIRIDGLENGVAYHIALLQVDDARNVSGGYLGQVTPQPVKDFWEDYHDRGGQADGGLCLSVGGGRGAPGGVLLIVAAALLAVRPWRGRRRALVAASAGLLALVAGLGSARAQGYDPYWERWDNEAETVQETIPHWNLAFKAGPYRPQVDDEFNLPAGQTPPFAAMFGTDDNFFGVFELERYFLFPEGQLGAYASVGLTSQRADAFQVNAAGDVIIDPETMKPVRAPGNRVVFRLVPMSIGAVYRFTALDDRAHVPIVPYGKVGLTYGLWWVRSPSGSLAEAPTPDCMDPDTGDCKGDRALGASLGWQAAIGIAIRAERLDPQAARNLRGEMGIEHAGFFAELMYAKVNGFGADDRLNVGDATWLAGINFEFYRIGRVRVIRLTLEYDGTGLGGWQRQDNAPTVQQHLEDALAGMVGAPTPVVGASRTDAGVHALGQVAHFHTESLIPLHGFRQGLTSALPPQIAVVDAVDAAPDFHARFSARGKHYRYTILNRRDPSPLLRDVAWWRPRPLDLDAMRAAAAALIGEHDFCAFRAAGCTARTTTRNITRIDITRAADLVHLDVRGNAFLRHMVRILTGTLLEVAESRRDPATLPALLAARDRTQAGQTAPPHGLTLVEVFYGGTGSTPATG